MQALLPPGFAAALESVAECLQQRMNTSNMGVRTQQPVL
jgi:hypothetical protein